MVQLLYKYDKCHECGHEGFQWGMLTEFTWRTVNEKRELEYHSEKRFFCHGCIKTMSEKLDDMVEDAKKKAFALKLGKPFTTACGCEEDAEKEI
jgi:hypothetical protein